jgi:hypothetical protein
MLVRPMLDSWEIPRIERIAAFDARRLVAFPVAGLMGDLHQDLGKSALAVEIEGSLSSDEARDEFLTELRGKYEAGEPIDFVADITKDSKLEQVLVAAFHVEEMAGRPDWFRYRMILREYTEPPPPPSPAGLDEDFGVDVDAELDLDVDLGLDMLDLPGLLADVPKLDDFLSPIETAAQSLKDTLGSAGEVLSPLADLLGGGS